MIVTRALLLMIALISACSCSEKKTEYSCDEITKLEELSFKNNLEAQKTLAKCYQSAADQEDPRAQFSLGVMYANGEGVEENLQKAVELYQKGADQGNEVVKNNLKDKSLQIATPFGLQIANITLSEIKAKYKKRKKKNLICVKL